MTYHCLGPQGLSGETECGENEGSEGFRVGEYVSISCLQREDTETHHMGDRIPEKKISGRLSQDHDGDPA